YDPMSALARITQRSAWHLVTTASTVSSDNLDNLEEETVRMLQVGILEHFLVRLQPGRMGMLHKSRQRDSVEPSKVVLPGHCVSSMNHSRGRSPGSCRWQYWELSLLPGSAVRACRKTHNNNRLCYGGPGYLRWESSSASHP